MYNPYTDVLNRSMNSVYIQYKDTYTYSISRGNIKQGDLYKNHPKCPPNSSEFFNTMHNCRDFETCTFFNQLLF